jgi:hypothetical protein
MAVQSSATFQPVPLRSHPHQKRTEDTLSLLAVIGASRVTIAHFRSVALTAIARLRTIDSIRLTMRFRCNG